MRAFKIQHDCVPRPRPTLSLSETRRDEPVIARVGRESCSYRSLLDHFCQRARELRARRLRLQAAQRCCQVLPSGGGVEAQSAAAPSGRLVVRVGSPVPSAAVSAGTRTRAGASEADNTAGGWCHAWDPHLPTFTFHLCTRSQCRIFQSNRRFPDPYTCRRLSSSLVTGRQSQAMKLQAWAELGVLNTTCVY